MKGNNGKNTMESVNDALNAALQLHSAGRLDEAEQGYRKVLAAAPDNPDVLHMLGVLVYQNNQFDDSVDLIEQALALKPHYPEALYNLGNTFRALGRFEAAMECYQKAVALKPAYAEAHNNLGLSLGELGRGEEAVESFKKAISVAPQLSEAHSNVGDVHWSLGRFDEALMCYETALSSSPNNVDVLTKLGRSLEGLARDREATACFERALAISPNFAPAISALGNALIRLKRPSEAAILYEKAVADDPGSMNFQNSLAYTLKELGRYEEALAAFEKALVLDPGNSEIHCNMGLVYRDLRQDEKATEAYNKALAVDPTNIGAHTLLIGSQNYVPGLSKDEMFEKSCHFGAMVAEKSTPYKDHENTRIPDRRLRIGFVSGDFRNHPVGYFLVGGLSALSADQVELFAYSMNKNDDSVTDTLKTFIPNWRVVRLMSDAVLAETIVNDKIDILIDLAGQTLGNRLPVFAWKPAPIQVAWIGYVATTGLKEMDYILCDRWVMPPEEEPYFVEKPVRLPRNYMCFSMPNFGIDVGPLPVDRNGFITFGSFNNLTKMNDQVIACWSQILQQIPNSRLYLKTPLLADSSDQEKTLKGFSDQGISADRLILEGASPRRDLLESYNSVDICLDTFPYTGGVTTIEALWMGVPVVTLRGNNYLGRIGDSILSNANLEDWVAGSLDDYVAVATRHASDIDSLRLLRASLRENVVQSSLWDSVSFARGLEDAFRKMWRDWCGAD